MKDPSDGMWLRYRWWASKKEGRPETEPPIKKTASEGEKGYSSSWYFQRSSRDQYTTEESVSKVIVEEGKEPETTGRAALSPLMCACRTNNNHIWSTRKKRRTIMVLEGKEGEEEEEEKSCVFTPFFPPSSQCVVTFGWMYTLRGRI